MWASHVHDLSRWADLVASERAKATCELHYLLTDMPHRCWAHLGRSSTVVPFGDVLSKFGADLDSTDTPPPQVARACTVIVA